VQNTTLLILVILSFQRRSECVKTSEKTVHTRPPCESGPVSLDYGLNVGLSRARTGYESPIEIPLCNYVLNLQGASPSEPKGREDSR